MSMLEHSKDKLLYWLSIVTTILGLLITVGIGAVTLYVRWVINKDFTFLGGFELEAITLGTFALLIALLFLYRPKGE